MFDLTVCEKKVEELLFKFSLEQVLKAVVYTLEEQRAYSDFNVAELVQDIEEAVYRFEDNLEREGEDENDGI